MTFSRHGRKIAGWVVLLATTLGGFMWIDAQPRIEQLQWWLAVSFGITLVIALDAHAKARELQQRVERLERNR